MPQPDSGDNCCDCPSRFGPCDDCGGATTGACCIRGSSECSVVSAVDCAAIRGYYFGDGTLCGDIDCSEVGCCQISVIGEGNHCIEVLGADCFGFHFDPAVFCCDSEVVGNATCCVKDVQHCCPSEFTGSFCCLTTEDCCGEDCCAQVTHTCCDGGDIGFYCCDNFTSECCGESGCCPIGFCIGGECTA